MKTVAKLVLVLGLMVVTTVSAQTHAGVLPSAQGTTAMPLFAVVYRAGLKWKVGRPMQDQDLRGHFLYLRGLREKGAVMVAGPLGKDGGLVILRASDQRDASKIVAADPAVVAGIFVGEAKLFLPRIGGAEALAADKATQ